MARSSTSHQTSNLAVVRGLQDTWGRIKGAKHLLSAGAWRRWAIAIVVGLLLCMLLSAVITRIAQSLLMAHGLQQWDERLLRWIEQQPLMGFHEAILLESPGNLSYLIPLTAVAAIALARAGRPVEAASVIAAYALQRFPVAIGWWTWDRPRPDLIAGGIAAPDLHSFPSGHIALAVAVYGFLGYLWMRASRSRVEQTLTFILVAAWCAMVGYARLRLGTHWPSDVIAGAVIGIAWLACVIIAVRVAHAEQTPGKSACFDPPESSG